MLCLNTCPWDVKFFSEVQCLLVLSLRLLVRSSQLPSTKESGAFRYNVYEKKIGELDERKEGRADGREGYEEIVC